MAFCGKCLYALLCLLFTKIALHHGLLQEVSVFLAELTFNKDCTAPWPSVRSVCTTCCTYFLQRLYCIMAFCGKCLYALLNLLFYKDCTAPWPSVRTVCTLCCTYFSQRLHCTMAFCEKCLYALLYLLFTKITLHHGLL